MAGSYQHVTDEHGLLLPPERLLSMIDSDGDKVETITELFGMVWWLANGNPFFVEEAAKHTRQGLDFNRRLFGPQPPLRGTT